MVSISLTSQGLTIAEVNPFIIAIATVAESRIGRSVFGIPLETLDRPPVVFSPISLNFNRFENLHLLSCIPLIRGRAGQTHRSVGSIAEHHAAFEHFLGNKPTFVIVGRNAVFCANAIAIAIVCGSQVDVFDSVTCVGRVDDRLPFARFVKQKYLLQSLFVCRIKAKRNIVKTFRKKLHSPFHEFFARAFRRSDVDIK